MSSGRYLFWLALMLALGLAPAAQAQIQTLGQVSVEVPDRETGSRNDAIEAGLEQVLVRLSGQQAPRQLPGASSLFASPARWVQQFGYEQPPAEGDDSPAAESGAAPALELAMQFDVSAVIGAMEKAGLPVWVTHRPPVLVWLVIQRPGFGEILARDNTDQSREAVLEQARARGLPLLLPAMNDRDQTVITPADIRGRFDQVLNQASEPYGARFRLAAVMYTGSTPKARWRLLDGMELLAEGDLTGDDEQQLLERLVDEVTDYFVARYTVTAGAGVERRLTVRGVGTLSDWHELEQYLGGLAGMKQARMASVAAREVQFALVFGGGDEQLLRLLEVNRHLTLCDAGVTETVSAPTGTLPAASAAPAEPEMAAELPPVCWTP